MMIFNGKYTNSVKCSGHESYRGCSFIFTSSAVLNLAEFIALIFFLSCDEVAALSFNAALISFRKSFLDILQAAMQLPLNQDTDSRGLGVR